MDFILGQVGELVCSKTAISYVPKKSAVRKYLMSQILSSMTEEWMEEEEEGGRHADCRAISSER